MKVWAVHYKTESCDNYYEVVKCKKKPTTEQLENYFVNYVETWMKGDEEEIQMLRDCGVVEMCWEIKEKKAREL